MIWNRTIHRVCDLIKRLQEPQTAFAKEIDKISRQLSRFSRTQFLPHQSRASAVFSQQSILRLQLISNRLEELNRYTLLFESTETWRSVYRDVLETVTASRYFSVALVRSEDYWQDHPAKASLELNYRLVQRGFRIHRVFIVDDFFWAPSARRPVKQVFDWIREQQVNGVDVSLLRYSDLENEPDLVCDFGIYGTEAVGTQITDFNGKTVRFSICFSKLAVQQAEERWKQLLLYAVPIESISE